MSSESYERVTCLLSELRRAIAIYERSILFADDPQVHKDAADAKKTYRVYRSDLREIQRRTLTQGQFVDHDLIISIANVCESINNIYLKTLDNIYKRHKTLSGKHGDSVDQAKKVGVDVADRSSLSGSKSVDIVRTKFLELTADISLTIEEDTKHGTWSLHEHEWAVLYERCQLLMGELTHLTSRIDIIGQLSTAKKTQKDTLSTVALSRKAISRNTWLVVSTFIISNVLNFILFLLQNQHPNAKPPRGPNPIEETSPRPMDNTIETEQTEGE